MQCMMAPAFNFTNLIRRTALLLTCAVSGNVMAQTAPVKMATVQVGQVKNAFIDRLGDYYLQTPDNQFVKYDQNGVKQGAYAPPEPPSLFDPWNGMKSFLYYKDQKTYATIDRFMHFFDSTRLDPAFSIDPVLVCPGAQNKIWILDAADWSIKRVNILLPEVEIDVPIHVGTTPNITSIREYENLLFLHDPGKGIYIYNILGIPVDSIPGAIPSYNFLGEELYYLQGNRLNFYDLFDGKKRTQDLPEPADFTLLTDDRLMIIHGSQMDVFKISPAN